MISMDQAFRWLTYGDRSHLSAANQLSLMQLNNSTIPAEHRKAILRELQIAADGNVMKEERLEIKLALGGIYYQSNEFSPAKVQIQDAVNEYKTASHRLGVAKWMLGILLRRMREYNTAQTCWFQAVDNFTGQAQARVRSHQADMVNWYIDKIDAMRLDMAQTAEEANSWLNWMEGSHLSPAAEQVKAEIRRRIGNNDYPLAYEVGLALSKVSKNRIDPLETAEAWAAIGLAALQMGNPRQAIDYLQRGASSFAPWGHQQAVCRWMIGIAYWDTKGEMEQAVRYWTHAIDAFKNLKKSADQDHDRAKVDWYDKYLPVLEKALKTKLGVSMNGG